MSQTILATGATGIVGSVVKQLRTQSFLSSLSSYRYKLGFKKSQIFTIIILIGICSSISLIAITSYTSAYAEKTRPVTITTIMSPRTSSPIKSSSTELSTVETNAALIPKIKILSPDDGQKVPVINNNLVVSGTSSDDKSKDCKVSILLNGVKPYQKTIATGKNGANDYSTWKYKLDPIYTVLRDGSNKLTTKITCYEDPSSSSKWTSINLIGTKEGNHRDTTGVTQAMPLGISIRIDKNPISVGDIQTITVTVFDPDSKNSDTSVTKVHGQILDLSLFPSASYSHKHVNSVVERFDGDTNKNGEVSYSWKVPKNTQIGTPYIVKVDAISDKYIGSSESNIFTIKPSNNDNVFILAQASRNFTNGLNNNIKNFTQEVFDKVTNSMENHLR
jgi:hypothetical protein